MSPLRIEPLATTGIGSLPHTQLELAMAQAFSLDIPYLPQLPRGNPAEQLLPMALDGLPGLHVDAEGRCTVHLRDWRREAKAFEKRLDRALQRGELAPFEPQATSCRAWKPFLWELRERGVRLAKAQLGGPITCIWALKTEEGGSTDRRAEAAGRSIGSTDGRRALDEPELVGQVYRLVLARALAMARAIAAADCVPILFFDEPGLVSLEPRHPQHLLRLSELRLAVLALAKEGARPGLHCCGNTAWGPLLGLGLSYLSIDARLSLDAVLEDGRAFGRFLEDGGRLALGLVPTDLDSAPELAGDIARGVLAALKRSEPGEKVLGQCLVTPACGLALRSVSDAERVFAELVRARATLREALPSS
jgi:hypothetical protein